MRSTSLRPPRLRALALLTLLLVGCATTTTTTATWVDPNAPPRTGVVQQVQEVVQTRHGDPAAGALAGALIGGFLFGGPRGLSIVGAAGGAAVGAAASQPAQARSYQVLVRFDDDGSFGWFVYRDYSPFRPGQPVWVTPQGLMPR
jgi:outer membrane lipoprotein SlyB